MKTISPTNRRLHRAARAFWFGVCLIGAVSAQTTWADEAKDEAKPDAKDESKAEAKEGAKEKAKEVLKPEQMFEGGNETYNNWVELSVGGFIASGNRSQAEARHRSANGAFGGIEDLHYQAQVATNTTLTVDGRALFDNEDYKLTLQLNREGTGYLRFNVENYRTWYNGDGGYYRPGDLWYPLSNDALAVDRGEISFEAGLRKEKVPKITVKYAHQYRDGEKGLTSWGITHPDANNSSITRALSPTLYDIDESRDIFQLDVANRYKATDFGVGLRYETADLDNARYITQAPGEPGQQRITQLDGTSYDMFSVHAFTETWIKKNLLFTSGFLFTDMAEDFSGSRIYGNDFDVSYAPFGANGLGYYDLVGTTHLKEYAVNLNLMAKPWKHVTITPSIRVQKEDSNTESSGMGTLSDYPGQTFSGTSDRGVLDVSERLDVRYTGLTNWVLYTRGEWTQGDGNLKEDGGLSLVNNIGVSPIDRATDDSRHFQKYSLGARWYARRGLSLDVGGYYKLNAYDYDHTVDSTPNGSVNRYPAYLTMQDFETYDGNVRLTWRPHPKVTLVSRYEYQVSTIHTKADALSGLGELESSEMTSHILAQNISWTPWSRLYLQAGANYVWSETQTPTSELTKAILDAQNNYWTVNFNSGYVVDDKTDLNLGYFFYQSDNFNDNFVEGLPLGLSAEEHGVTATVSRRLSSHVRLTLRYGYFNYDETTFGGNQNNESHWVFSSLQYRF